MGTCTPGLFSMPKMLSTIPCRIPKKASENREMSLALIDGDMVEASQLKIFLKRNETSRSLDDTNNLNC